MGRFSLRGKLAGDLAHGLHQLLGHPADRGKNFAQGESREQPPALLDTVFALARGSFLEGVIHAVADPAGLLDSLLHGKNQTRDGHLRPLRKVKAVGGMRPNSIPPPRFSQIRLTFTGMNEHNGHLGLMAVTLPDHLSG